MTEFSPPEQTTTVFKARLLFCPGRLRPGPGSRASSSSSWHHPASTRGRARASRRHRRPFFPKRGFSGTHVNRPMMHARLNPACSHIGTQADFRAGAHSLEAPLGRAACINPYVQPVNRGWNCCNSVTGRMKNASLSKGAPKVGMHILASTAGAEAPADHACLGPKSLKSNNI